jgi:hypothetical protein
MRTRAILILALANLFLCAAAEQSNSERQGRHKQAMLEITVFHATHTGPTLTFQGKVKNIGEVPARDTHLVFSLLDAKKKVISTRRAPIDEESLGSGEECGFFFESSGNEDAVAVRIEATEGDSREAHLDNGGPHPIE